MDAESAEQNHSVSKDDQETTISSQPGDRLPITVAAKISKSLELKEEGNSLFKQQKWKKAIKKYHYSHMYAKGITDRPDKLMGMDVPTRFLKPTPEEERKAEEILISTHNNIAACLVKTCEWERAVDHTVKVLELRPGNAKALFRQGLCYLNLGKLDEAGKLLRKAETIDPRDVSIKKQLQLLRHKEEEQAKREQRMCKAMFAESS